MTTIYIVTSGDYSSYGINGVYSTYERAMDHVNAMDREFYRPQVEPYELDSPFNPETAMWMVTISDRGEGKSEANFQESIPPDYRINAAWREQIRRIFGEEESLWRVYVRAPDKDHALKIGQDLIAAFRAESLMWESL
jgi:hypothetical protein